ncbi:hypothetical protein B9Q13_03480 [Candidatus Marsarchaeota G2 archaeon ECH_B_SAG-G16]|jgi:tRNA (cytidine56-2'-O)-methyltransferase|uniref:tRNA (cytidine(56)-2'-O)-methyltransferase n=5 Tax=Candidatus Marsarchaeota TaxID=1978152 RepID=A0A2R6AH30_9ARCH|nr:MAG: hypothetical protein B9Q02_05575 [Candidatus Marsarchaeota G1 archaeon BE_D]PSN89154.1 MAG: hypothetical protein B9Q00_02755 [Candidatus Marsarchaeota G1 archaeon OSP_C]PSO04809.1 MAG: hypothetical protein B9Q13_03480 [Candidatus Marsarchaeota G2 archaeon ECH_B_SAG-G16]
MTNPNELIHKSKQVVLRLNHREKRDDRLTTHVCLVARAFLADGVIISNVKAEKLIKKINEVTEKWGNDFWVLDNLDASQIIKEWKENGGVVANLSMYGESIYNILSEIYFLHYIKERPLMVIVGSAKVPNEIYQMADFNVSITNQPHSEAAALAIFLEKLNGSKVYSLNAKTAELKVSPRLKYKGRVEHFEKNK